MIGKTISHYKIIDKLGGGGMGVVYKAEDTKLKRFVALKFLPSDLTRDEEAKERFVQEAQAASALDHPNICTIHEIDETQDGQLFIAMAYYEGETLKKKVSSEQLSVNSVIDFAIQIAQGLAKAHRHGIVHRDIKPANVIVTNEGVAKVIDFGLAKLIGSKGITKTPSTIGTVAYMSPEQVQGESVDYRTDIWSLGVVLYEMLAGQFPFKGDADPAVIYSIMNEEPEPITVLRPDLPMALAQIVERALQKDRNERYHKIDELITELRLLKRDALTIGMLSKTRGIRKAMQKSSRGLALPATILTAAILAVIGYFIFSGGQQKDDPERIPVVVIDVVNETKEDELNGLAGILVTALEQSRRLSVLTRSRMFDVLSRMGKESTVHIDEMLGREICNRADIGMMAMASIKKFGQVYTMDIKLLDVRAQRYLLTANEKGEGQESIPDLIDRLAERIRRGLHEEEADLQTAKQRVAQVTTSNLEAYQHYFQGEQLLHKFREQEAQKQFEKAIALDSTFGLAYFRLAQTKAWYFGDEGLAKEAMQKAVALLDRMPENYRYLVRAQQARYEEGFEAAIAILKEMEQIYPNDEQMLYSIGHACFWIGRHPEAARYFERVVELNPSHGLALDYLSRTYDRLGSNDKMLEFARRYATVSRTAESYTRLAGAFTALGKIEDALQTMQHAHQLFPEDHLIVDGIADLYMLQEKYDQAEAELLSLVDETQTPAAKRLGYLSLSYFYPYLGKYRESLKYLDAIVHSCWQAKDTSNAATHLIRKAMLLVWGWNDSTNAAQAVQQTYRFHHRIKSRYYWPYLASFLVQRGEYAAADSLARAISKTTTSVQASARVAALQWYHSYIAVCIQYAKKECARAGHDSLFTFLEHNYRHLVISLSYLLAECQFEAGEFDRALRTLHEMQAVRTNFIGIRAVFYPKSFYLLGRIHEQKGDGKRAIENYQKLLALWQEADPDLPELSSPKDVLAKLPRA